MPIRQIATNAIVLCCLAQSCSFLESAASEPQQIRRSDLSKDDLKNLQTVSTAQHLQGPYLGRGGGSPVWGAYSQLRDLDSKVLFPKLNQLMPTATPSGKIYLACAYWDQDKTAGLKAFRALLNDKSMVDYRSGCTDQANETVSAIAKAFIEKGFYRDFSAKKY